MFFIYSVQHISLQFEDSDVQGRKLLPFCLALFIWLTKTISIFIGCYIKRVKLTLLESFNLTILINFPIIFIIIPLLAIIICFNLSYILSGFIILIFSLLITLIFPVLFLSKGINGLFDVIEKNALITSTTSVILFYIFIFAFPFVVKRTNFNFYAF